MSLTAYVSTKNRYDVLPLALLSLAQQTIKNFDVIIFDDNDNPQDIRQIPSCTCVLQLFDQYGIKWRVLFGKKMGQHYNHQMAQEVSESEWLFRFDDDHILEPDTLRRLLSHAGKTVGAVAGLVLPPQPSPVPENAANKISDLSLPNIQWFTHPYVKLVEVEHLHSTFLYRRGVEKFELSLSPAAHREETIFTHGIKRKGYQLLVDSYAITWHFRAGHGGIRSHQDSRFWTQDEQIFSEKLAEWGVHHNPVKTIVLDCGAGDHVIVKKLLPMLKEKYGKVVLATCFPDIFKSDSVEQISIAEAQQRLGDLSRFNIYKAMIDWNWKGSLEDAFRKMYGIERSHP